MAEKLSQPMRAILENPMYINPDDRVMERLDIFAAIQLGDPRLLYRLAWRMRRKQFNNCYDRYLYDYYQGRLEDIRDGSELGRKCYDQIHAVAHQVLGQH